MTYLTVFQLVCEEFKKANIPFILIGGFAVNAYGVSRNTGDVDFLVALENLSDAMHMMEKHGYKKFDEGEFFCRWSPIRSAGTIVDFVLVDRITLDKMIHEAKETKIGGFSLMIPSLNHLIALKLHAIKNNPTREPKDLIDIFDLIKKNNLDVNTDEFRKLCLKFGSETIYNRITEVMK